MKNPGLSSIENENIYLLKVSLENANKAIRSLMKTGIYVTISNKGRTYPLTLESMSKQITI